MNLADTFKIAGLAVIGLVVVAVLVAVNYFGSDGWDDDDGKGE